MIKRRAIILTALQVEFNAVCAHLADLHEEVHKGSVYERGKFAATRRVWDVGVVQIDPSNDSAAFEAERAIERFDATVALFVGVAGGIKDVRVGDVVAATKVYGYESGKVEEVFKTRPDVGNSSHSMVQRAKAEARRENWRERILGTKTDSPPRAFVGPIAAGEKVVAATQSDLFNLLRDRYNDTLAVEMEGRGFLKATHANEQVVALVVRGISDLIDNKSDFEDALRQKMAVRHASAFAFQVLANLESVKRKPWLSVGVVSFGVVSLALAWGIFYNKDGTSKGSLDTPTMNRTDLGVQNPNSSPASSQFTPTLENDSATRTVPTIKEKSPKASAGATIPHGLPGLEEVRMAIQSKTKQGDSIKNVTRLGQPTCLTATRCQMSATVIVEDSKDKRKSEDWLLTFELVAGRWTLVSP